MNLLYGDARYANVVEETLYNALLAGVSLSGEKFFYTNPLASEGRHHRGAEYGIACCPSNMARFIPSVGKYIYMAKDNELLVNLFVGSETKTVLGTTPVTISQKTNYPWEGQVTLHIKPDAPVEGKLKVRIPDWCTSYTIALNGQAIDQKEVERGYLTISSRWKKDDVITVDLPMPVEIVAADPRGSGECREKSRPKRPYGVLCRAG